MSDKRIPINKPSNYEVPQAIQLILMLMCVYVIYEIIVAWDEPDPRTVCYTIPENIE